MEPSYENDYVEADGSGPDNSNFIILWGFVALIFSLMLAYLGYVVRRRAKHGNNIEDNPALSMVRVVELHTGEISTDSRKPTRDASP